MKHEADQSGQSPEIHSGSKPQMRMIVFVVIILALMATAFYYFSREARRSGNMDSLPSAEPSPSIPTSSPTTSQTTDNDAYQGWKTYTNDDYGFTFKYPEDWQIHREQSIFDSSILKGTKIYAEHFTSTIGTKFSVFPEGEFDHDFDSALQSKDSIKVGQEPATKYRYVDGFVFISLDNLHNFRIEFTPANNEDNPILDMVLEGWEFTR